MTGRGIDQVLPHPSDPELHEAYVKSAWEYVELARHRRTFSYPVNFSYIWGTAMEEWAKRLPDLRVTNLETSITRSTNYWKGKGIHYKMHPGNIPVLNEARIDCCCLANNHILDWEYSGLEETLVSLKQCGLKSAGAGRNLAEASAPFICDRGRTRILVFSYGAESSGIPAKWAATETEPGVNMLEDLSQKTFDRVKAHIETTARPDDFIIISIHWGGNWGYRISAAEIEFAHRLIDEAGADVIHGHSSHHVKAIEVYKGRLVLYGCGDFVNDYEGIGGFEEFRGDLNLMYFASFDSSSGRLICLEMVPTKMEAFKVVRASRLDAEWLLATLNRECGKFCATFELSDKNDFNSPSLIMHSHALQ